MKNLNIIQFQQYYLYYWSEGPTIPLPQPWGGLPFTLSYSL